MAVPTGTASLLDIQDEFGGSNPIGFDEYRGVGPGPSSGAISIDDFRGASNNFTFAITANQTNANLRTLAVAAGWNQSAAVIATINSGVIITGSVAANSTAALTINGAWAGGVTLINNGTIRGRGGNGGRSAGYNSTRGAITSGGGAAGGRALLVSVACTIQNNGAIQGGAGGGGGGGAKSFSGQTNNTQWHGSSGGGGGGGGWSSLSNSAGGAASISNYGFNSSNRRPGSAGAGGSYNAYGAGGASGLNSTGSTNTVVAQVRGGAGGRGGNLGAAGSSGLAGTVNADNHSQNNFQNVSQSGGGAAGQAVNGNSNITWTATGTRTGPIV